MRTNKELSPLKREIESIFSPRNIDTDCDTMIVINYPQITLKSYLNSKYWCSYPTE